MTSVISGAGVPRHLDISHASEWREALSSLSGATVFHSPEWASVFAEAYGHRPELIHMSAGSESSWALPVSTVRGPFGNPSFVSMPYSDFAGPLAPVGMEASACIAASIAVGGSIEIRTDIDLLKTDSPSNFSTYRIELPADENEMLQKLPKKAIQYALRKAIRDGIAVRHGTDRDVAVFHRLMSATRRRHGLPTPPIAFYAELFARFVEKGNGALLIAQQPSGSVLAASFFLWHGEWGYYKYSAGSHRAETGNASHLILWEGVRESIRRGCKTFDLGRTSKANIGLTELKQRWDGSEVPLYYMLVSPDGCISRIEHKEGLLFRLMRTLLPRSPDALTKLIGNLTYKYFS